MLLRELSFSGSNHSHMLLLGDQLIKKIAGIEWRVISTQMQKTSMQDYHLLKKTSFLICLLSIC